MHPFVVHCKRAPYDVYCGRPSKHGNPFTHLQRGKTRAQVQVATRQEAIDKHKLWLDGDLEMIELVGYPPPTQEEIERELKGKILGCWCYPLACHCTTLAERANR